ncbi:MAG: hypothetical protein MJ211_15315 [Bacteroidales bacterium]|nr:hypothetical protein [Bacteroidales bacterium]
MIIIIFYDHNMNYNKGEYYIKYCNLKNYELSDDSSFIFSLNFTADDDFDRTIRPIFHQYVKKMEKITIWYKHKGLRRYIYRIKVKDKIYNKYFGDGPALIFLDLLLIVSLTCIIKGRRILKKRIQNKQYASDYYGPKDDS